MQNRENRVTKKFINDEKIGDAIIALSDVQFLKMYIDSNLSSAKIKLGNELILEKNGGLWTVYTNQVLTVSNMINENTLKELNKEKNKPEKLILGLFINEGYAFINYDPKIHGVFNKKWIANDDKVEMMKIKNDVFDHSVCDFPIYADNNIIEPCSERFISFLLRNPSVRHIVEIPRNSLKLFSDKIVRSIISGDDERLKMI